MSANITFQNYPASNRVPGTFAEVSNSNANTASVNQNSLINGPMLVTGSATANEPVLVSGADPDILFGAGSVLALMCKRYQGIDAFGTVWALPVADASVTLATSAAAASGATTLTFATGAALSQISVGEAASGTGIAAGTTVDSIDPTTGIVTLSAATTAAITQGEAITFGAATAASATITIGGSATAAGVLSLYIAGTLISTAVAVNDAASTIATNMAAEIAATPGLPVLATAANGVVTVTSLNKGLVGNDIDLRLNYLGTAGGQVTPAGITVTFGGGTQSGSGYLLSGGQTNPSLTAALANLPTENFDFIATAFTDTASLSALDTFLDDTTGRWSWEQELFGGYFGAYRGTLAELSTYGTSNNNQHGSIMSIFDVPEPAWVWAAGVMAYCAISIRANPSVPLQNIDTNLMPPPLASRFDIGERNTLLYDGLSTFKVNQGGVVVIERMITTYQTNAAGQPDNSYLDVETMYQLTAYIRDARTFLSSRYPRSILVANGTSIPFGSAMVTAQVILASIVARYRTLARNGLVQEPDQFAKLAQAQNKGNGLVALYLPVMLANQLRQTAMLVQFTKP